MNKTNKIPTNNYVCIISQRTRHSRVSRSDVTPREPIHVPRLRSHFSIVKETNTHPVGATVVVTKGQWDGTLDYD